MKTRSIKVGAGADPEFFVYDKRARRIASAHKLVPGSKEAPAKLRCGAVQVDGTAIEYNIKPAFDAKAFERYNIAVLKQIRKLVPEKRFDFVFEPFVVFDKYYFDGLPQQPKVLGCNPDYDAYTGRLMKVPDLKGIRANMRTGAGHIHLSWGKNLDTSNVSHRWDCNTLIRILEYFLIPYFNLFDNDEERRALYGARGSIRYKSYGVEWRYPSNAWLKHPELWTWIFEATTFFVKKMSDGVVLSPYTAVHANQVFYRIQFDNKRKMYVEPTRERLNENIIKIFPDFPLMPPFKGEPTHDTAEAHDLPILNPVEFNHDWDYV